MTKPTATIELKPGTVYLQDCNSKNKSKLYTLDLDTGQATLIGEIITEVYDIAFVGSQLYGLARKRNKTQLIKIDLNSGDTTVVGDIGFITAGLAYDPKRQILYATTAKQLISINLETGKGTQAVTVADKDYNCGEVAFDGDGIAYITLIGYNKKKVLARCNLDTGKVETIGDTGFPDLASLAFIGDVLYGVTGNFFNLGKDGQLIRIDTNTGKGTLVTTTHPIGRWAGMTIYEPVTQETSVPDSTATPSAQTDTTIKEEDMKLLTIDTKNNCYVIDPEGMNNLQQNVAKSFTLEKGTFNIQIANGRYSPAESETQGEPFVLLWIYGLDGNTFINKNTGIEVGATWTTLNGNNDQLQLEVKNKAVLCALFFDLNKTDNSGSVELVITSDKQFFNFQKLVVDSKENCYVLNQEYLSSLQQQDTNCIELNPGNYRIKIREANATYWSNEQKFQLEPWALMWIKGGKFISKFTGIEVQSTWCSLNGLTDEVIIEVKEKTTLSGFFFDTYKDDNEGQIILAIEPVSATELTKIKEENVTNVTNVTTGTTISESLTGVGTGSSSNVGGGSFVGTSSSSNVGGGSFVGTGSSSNVGGGSFVGTGSEMNFGGGSGFTFRFDENQMEEMWKNLAAKIETSVTLPDKQDGNKTQYWNNLESWILQRYQDQAKQLAMQVARVEFMTKALTQQMEVNFNQTFQGWTNYFDQRLERLISTRIYQFVEEQVNQKLSQQTQDIKKLVVEQMQSDIDKRIETTLNLRLTQQAQDIKKLVVEQMQSDMNKQIETTLNLKITDQSKELNNQVIKQIQGEMDKRIESVVNLKIDAQTEPIKNLVIQQIEGDIDRRLDTKIDLKVEPQAETIKNLVIQQLQGDIERRLEAVVNLKAESQTEPIKNLVIQQLQGDIDRRLEAVVNLKITDQIEPIKNLVIQQIEGDIDRRLDTKIDLKVESQTEPIKNLVIQQLQGDIDRRLEAVVNLKITDQIEPIKNLVIQQIEGDIDRRLDTKIDLKVESQTEPIKNLVIQQLQGDIDRRLEAVVNLKVESQTEPLKNLVIQQLQGDIDRRLEAVVNLKVGAQTEPIKNLVIQQLQGDIDRRLEAVVNLKITDQIEPIKNLVIQQLQGDIDERIAFVVDQSTDNNVQLVVNNVMNNIDDRINVNFENKLLNFHDDVSSIVRNEINQNFADSITTNVLSDLKKQQFYLDMQLIKAEVENFYARLGQFETQVNIRINQGDTRLYNWTLEQLVALQGCITDRQALMDLFESFSTNLKTVLDGSPCVQPTRFTQWVTPEQSQFQPMQPSQLPEGQ